MSRNEPACPRSFRLTVQYDGTGFHGWQEQPGLRTAQGILRDEVASLVGERVDVPGAGRTDRGVHAMGQVAGFRASTSIPSDRLAAALNGRLPRDLRVSEAVEAPSGFHPRFSALGKHYTFLIDCRLVPCVFLACRAVHAPGRLDVVSMREAASVLVGEQDFAAFRSRSARRAAGAESARGDDPARGAPPDPGVEPGDDGGGFVSPGTSTVRTVYHVSVAEERGLVAIDVWGRSFLYKMVRTIAGSLLEIGRGRRSADWLRDGLRSRDRRRTGPTLPAHGLCLRRVYYDPACLEAAWASEGLLEGIDPWKSL